MNGKRRAGHVNSPELSTPDPPKRIRKRNDDTHFPSTETVESTQELGDKIISLLKRSQDKNGRLIASQFLELPDRNDYPDYYETIMLPMSINVIEKKLQRGDYATMTDLESDLKRMVQNAKDYNDSKSEVFEDAERIRKALSNFMPKHNPAYQDPEYRAVPTPIPDHVSKVKLRDSSVSGSEPGTIKLRLNTGGRPRSAAPSEPAETGSIDGEQQQIMLDMLDQLSEQEHAINFELRPPRREIPEYYRIIKNPTSINDVRKMVQSAKVKTWHDFARETRLIWTNAKEYNEPGSEIFLITENLESWVEERLQANGVPPKVVPRLSLKTASQPPQLKLKMGTPIAPAPSPGVNGYTVDKAALERQNISLQSALSRARDKSEATSTPGPTALSSLRRSVSIADLDTPMTGMNGHTLPPIDPSKPFLPPSGPSHLPTPTIEGEPPRQGLAPTAVPAPLVNGHHPSFPQQPIFIESTNPIDRRHRDPNRSCADALIQSVTYATNPLIPSDPKWKLVRQAHPAKTQVSYSTYLPHNYASLRISPDLHPDLRAGKRKYKIFVLNNNAVLPASPDVAGQGVYDVHLVSGENVLVVEAISALKEGERKDYAKEWEQFDFERVTFYIYLRPKGS